MQSNANDNQTDNLSIFNDFLEALVVIESAESVTLDQITKMNDVLIKVTGIIIKSVKDFSNIKKTLKDELVKIGEEGKLEEIYFKRVIEPLNGILRNLNAVNVLKKGNYYCHALTAILAEESPGMRLSERMALRNGFKKFIIDTIWNEDLLKNVSRKINSSSGEEVAQATKVTQNLADLKLQISNLINLECLKIIECPNGVVAFAEYKRLKEKGENVTVFLTDQSMTTLLSTDGGVAIYDEQENKQMVLPEIEKKGNSDTANMVGIIKLKSGITYHNSLDANKNTGISFTLDDLKNSPQEIVENGFYVDGIPFIIALRNAGEECPIILSTGDLKNKGGFSTLVNNYYPNLTQQEIEKLQKNLVIFSEKDITWKKVEDLLFTDPARVKYFKDLLLQPAPINKQMNVGASFHEVATPRVSTPLPFPQSPVPTSPYTPQSPGGEQVTRVKSNLSLEKLRRLSFSSINSNPGTPGSDINSPGGTPNELNLAELPNTKIKMMISETYKILIQNDKEGDGYDNILDNLLLEKDLTQDMDGLVRILRFLFYLEKFMKQTDSSSNSYAYNTMELFKNIIFLLGQTSPNNRSSLNTLLFTISPENSKRYRYKRDPENLASLLSEFTPENKEKTPSFSFLFNLEVLNIFIKLGVSPVYMEVKKFPYEFSVCGNPVTCKNLESYPFFYDVMQSPFFWDADNFDIITMFLKSDYVTEDIREQAISNTIYSINFNDLSPKQLSQLFDFLEKLLDFGFKIETTKAKKLNSGNIILALSEKLKKPAPEKGKQKTKSSRLVDENFYKDDFMDAGKPFLDSLLARYPKLMMEKNKNEQSPFKVAYHAGENVKMVLYFLNKMNSQDPDLGVISELSTYTRSDRRIEPKSNELHYILLQDTYRRDCWRAIHCAIRLRMDPQNDGKMITSEMIKVALPNYISTYVPKKNKKDKKSSPSTKTKSNFSSPETEDSSNSPSPPKASTNMNFSKLFSHTSSLDNNLSEDPLTLQLQFNKDLEEAADLEGVNLNDISREEAFEFWRKNRFIHGLYLFQKPSRDLPSKLINQSEKTPNFTHFTNPSGMSLFSQSAKTAISTNSTNTSSEYEVVNSSLGLELYQNDHLSYYLYPECNEIQKSKNKRLKDDEDDGTRSKKKQKKERNSTRGADKKF